MSSGNRGHFRTSFLGSRRGRQAISAPTPTGPTALVLAQEAEDADLHLPVFCLVPAPQAHPTVSRPRGATFNRCAKRLLPSAHRALVLALTSGVDLPLPELGFD